MSTAISKHAMAKAQTRTEALLYLQQHQLSNAHAFVSLNNKSNLIPYHNFDHLLTVTKWCGRLAGMLNLPQFETKALLLAAIFHDFDHSGGKEEDSVNVEHAVEALRYFCKIHRERQDIEDFAVDCIRVTEFPFVREPQNVAQKIIRDADLLQSIEPNYEEVLVGGLRKELEIKFKRRITRAEFCKMQVSFLESLKFYTRPAEVMYAASKVHVYRNFARIAASAKRVRVPIRSKGRVREHDPDL